MEIKFNRNTTKDKIYACWLGKNIGGTLGAPYEASTELQDIKGFVTEKGAPVPNDDLDLQLVWLYALEQRGVRLTAADLADMWASFISPCWNEYGICKGNIAAGLLPPLTGEYGNESWKNSNGAWIRSEIWACLCPGIPNAAMKYAYYDACVDHGLSEGTYAEMFTAAIESYAFVETDIRTIIELGLACIPETCRVSKTVRFVLDEYDKKTPWREVRQKIVEVNADLGWFQAPGNLGFVALGLIYGEGDFKKTLTLAVNCGDDTDCTGATCGAFLGIMGGTAIIPEDWKDYVGNKIVTCSINGELLWVLPKTCEELTQRVMALIPSMLYANDVYMEYTESESVFNKEEAKKICAVIGKEVAGFTYLFTLDDIKKRMSMNPYLFEVYPGGSIRAVVEYEAAPKMKPLSDLKAKVYLKNYNRSDEHADFSVALPDGWSADYEKSGFILTGNAKNSDEYVWEITIHSGETVHASNRIFVNVITPQRPLPLTLPMVILG